MVSDLMNFVNTISLSIYTVTYPPTLSSELIVIELPLMALYSPTVAFSATSTRMYVILNDVSAVLLG